MAHNEFASEKELVDSLNLSANKGFRRIGNLTRAFHINTVVGRMLSPWVWSLSRTGPKKYLEKHPITQNMKDAYILFKDEVLKAIVCLPDKMGFDVESQQIVPVLDPIYKAFPEIEYLDCKDPIQHIRAAWNIHGMIWGSEPSQTRNCMNFLELIRDEFYVLGELTPALREERLTPIEDIYQELDEEIAFYYNQLYRRNSGTPKHYHICPIRDGKLYVELPSADQLQTFLLQQNWKSSPANLRTVDGYVPYNGGGVAFHALPLLARGVKPSWYQVGDDYMAALHELVQDGWFSNEREAEEWNQPSSYSKECEWVGRSGLRWNWKDVAYVWLPERTRGGYKDERSVQEWVSHLRQFVPAYVPIQIGR